jgi:uncharacterized protein (TIGR02996 family)
MSEDEAFIRAVVDNPGDDLPRLVYADWLDDRDDPRGAYLREELAVVNELRSRDELSLPIDNCEELAAGLGPVWVARVSRPPVGVCCDGLVWRQRGPVICPADVERFESRFGIILPPAQRALLLNCNGGFAEPVSSPSPGDVRGRGLCRLYSLAGTSQDDLPFSLEYEFTVTRHSIYRGTPRENDAFRVGLRDYMILGRSGYPALVLLGTGGANFGRIRLHPLFDDDGVATAIPRDALSFDSLPEYLCSLLAVRV